MTVSGMTEAGDYRFRFEADFGACGALADEIIITADTGSVPGVIQGGTTVCRAGNQGALTLAGYEGAILRWESAPAGNWSGPITTLPNTSATQAYANLTQNTEFRAAVKTGDCPAATTQPVLVSVVAPPDQADAGTDRAICGVSVTLSGNTPNTGAGEWTLLSGPGRRQLSNRTALLLRCANLQPGVYQLEYRIENPPCARFFRPHEPECKPAACNAGAVAGP